MQIDYRGERQLRLITDWWEIYKKLLDTYKINSSLIPNFDETASPVYLTSIIYKSIPKKKRKVKESCEFNIPSQFNNDWIKLKECIQNGADLTRFLSGDTAIWNKPDFLLTNTGLHHLHLKSKKGKGIADELVFAFVDDDTFYATYFGCHNDFDGENAKKIVDIFNSNFPGKLNIAKKQEEGFWYDKNLANNPNLQPVLLKPFGILDGPQHSILCTFNNGKDKVPMAVITAYNNEHAFLHQLESDYINEKIAKRVKKKKFYDVNSDEGIRLIDIDFKKKQYVIKMGIGKQPKRIPFIKNISSSSIIANSNLI